jgi:hypothetical protein
VDLYSASMIAESEHLRRVAQAEQTWRRTVPAVRGIGLVGRIRALVALAGAARTERIAERSTAVACRERQPIGASS